MALCKILSPGLHLGTGYETKPKGSSGGFPRGKGSEGEARLINLACVDGKWQKNIFILSFTMLVQSVVLLDVALE